MNIPRYRNTAVLAFIISPLPDFGIADIVGRLNGVLVLLLLRHKPENRYQDND